MPMRYRRTVQTWLFKSGYVAMLVLLVAPLIVVISTSFTQSSQFQFPPEALSLKWYVAFLEDPAWIRSVKNSVIVGLGTTVVSTTLALLASIGIQRSDSELIRKAIPLTLLPLFFPPVVLGVALLAFLGSYNLHQSYESIIIAHSLWAAPISFLILQSVLTQVDWGIRDAALDLGATPLRTFIEIVVPQIKEGLFASALIAFIVSLQEFIMALFLSGYDTRTIPVLAWSSISQILDPIVNVVSTLLILVVVVALVLSALWIGLDQLARQL